MLNLGSGNRMRAKLLNSLNQFLDDYPGMSTAPHCSSGICLRGKFSFKAVVSGGEEIEDNFRLEIIVPDKFPQALPKIKEIGAKIPRNGDFHVNHDGTLCLGSPLRLMRKIYENPSVSGFVNECLVPYLYAVSHKIKNGGNFVFGGLVHGETGIMDDYSELFGLKDHSQVAEATRLLGLKKRIANKRPCPCRCGKRLGACAFRHRLNEFRKMAPVSWFKAHAQRDWNRI